MGFIKNNKGSIRLIGTSLSRRRLLVLAIIAATSAVGCYIFSLFDMSLTRGHYFVLWMLFVSIGILSGLWARLLLHPVRLRDIIALPGQNTMEKKYIEQIYITNQKLQQANEIIEKSSIIVFDWSIAPGIPVKYVSNNIRMFGYDPNDFYTGDVDYWDMVHPDDVKRTQNTVWKARSSGLTNNSHRYRIMCRNGEVRWVEEWTLLERDAEGNLVAEKGIIRDISDQVESEEKIRHLSYYDKLTGLYNRTYWDQVVLSMDKPHLHPISIVIGDMNGLKLTNDAFGHKQGDEMLISMSNILKSVFGTKSIVARLGGDEFAVLITNTDASLVSKLCSKVRSRCVQASSEPIKLSIALGYATKTSADVSISDIMREADDNMYRNKLNESNSIRSSIISSLRTTLEEKNIETREHADRIKKLSLSIGKALELTDSSLDELAIASDMHDIGKIGISDSILLKADKLTEEEWSIIKKHPEIGYHIILSSPKLASIAEYILAHHERWDGKGYPRGLKENEIPLLSRIISIADAYDAMTNTASYRRQKTKEEALEELHRCAGTQFDPDLVEVFCSILKLQ